MKSASEAETVIKRILPYLMRRGYDIEKDLSFEDPVGIPDTARTGFIDILAHCGRVNPVFLIEAKRDGTKITAKYKAQALEYGKGKGVLLVAVTNGKSFELLNTATKKPLLLNGTALDRIPSKRDLMSKVLGQLKSDPLVQNIILSDDRSLPYRPGLPLSKLNHLIKQCHNSIRKIEKNEEHAFSDFSKFMFLKLLEEKWDQEQKKPPYTFTFHEMAAEATGKGDRVKALVNSMIQTIQKSTRYADVLADPIKLTKDASYQTIVRRIASVSFTDCDLDSKGAAFEYFVRATLKGKKLGQYFTPRPLVRLMLHLGRWEQILSSLASGGDFKVLDPACGTGGFLVLAMNQCLAEVDRRLKAREIHKTTAETLSRRVKEDVFYGIDAHEGVACSAKMNMIIADDGYNNIRCADSLNESILIPKYHSLASGQSCTDGKAHLILTNPPFGTSEAESLSVESADSYAVRSTRGQSLFIQKMIQSAYADSLIVTVIDEGVLNTASYAGLRRLVMKSCRIEAVLSLPAETFKPNKINVRSSVLVLKKREDMDEDIADDYPISFICIDSLGYDGSGEDIRRFDLPKLIAEVEKIEATKLPNDKVATGFHWSAFRVQSQIVKSDNTVRLDVRYWHPTIRAAIKKLNAIADTQTVQQLNTIETKRGKSPPAAEYVSGDEGYALVVKSGSNISKAGELVVGGDYIERSLYEEYLERGMVLQDGDILLASTGDGTIGKCCVYRHLDENGHSRPGIPEGHVTVIRVDQSKIYPEYLCDYLRKGFGHDQLYRAFTGSTGMVEITPDDVNGVVVPPLPPKPEQKLISDKLRKSEKDASDTIARSLELLRDGESAFRLSTTPAVRR